MTDPPLTVVLDGSLAEPALLGSKGASLDHLLTLGLLVPRTGAVTTVAYRLFVDDPALRSFIAAIRAGAEPSAEEVDDTFLSTPLGSDMEDAIADLAAVVGDGHDLSVRSSATVEDLPDSSFAGQYRTILEVDSTDTTAVIEAVRLVFASLWHPAPRAYRAAMGVPDDAASMAVVLMRMVPAVRAGVVFTVDPGGRDGAARIEAVEGLGESLVSGRRTPDAWVTDRRADDDLPVEASAALAAALRIEHDTAVAQDVEWAWDGDRLWVLQARPITTVTDDEGDGFDSYSGDHDLTTAGIGEMLPGVLPPLLWELDSHFVDEAFRSVLDDLDVSFDDLDQTHLVRRVRGRAALDFSRLQHMAAGVPGNAAEELESQYFGSRRAGRSAALDAEGGPRIARLRHDRRVLRARRRYALEGETVVEAVREICDHPVDLAPMNNTEVLRYRLALIDLAIRTTSAEVSVAAAATAAYRAVELFLLPHLGDVDAGRQAEALTSGRQISVTPDVDASAAVFGGPTWRELGRNPVSIAATTDGADPLGELERQLDTVPSWTSGPLRTAMRVRALRHSTHDAVEQLRRRERVKGALLRLGGEIRRVHLELGRRLVENDTLALADDIELLTTIELVAATRGSSPGPLVIAHRRRWRNRYESEPPLPARFRGRPEEVEIELPSGGRFDGWAASPGRIRGRAQVLDGPEDSITPGAILVATATDASWSPLFVDAGGIVLERGGPLSHAAILARELGVPAVLNVPGATALLDHAEVTVDGDHGVVVLHDNEAAR